MSRATVECRDALRLVHRERSTKQTSIIEVVECQVATLAIELFAHIIAGVHLMSILQGSNGELGDFFHRQVQVLPVMSIISMAVILHLIGLVIRATRVVHHHQESTIQAMSYRLLVEALRSIFLSLAHLLAVLVTEGIGKLLHWFAKCQRQHVIDGSEHLILTSLDGARLLALCHHLAQLQAILTQLAADEFAHLRSVVAGESFRLRTHRSQAILLSQVGNAAESTTIVDRVLEEELHLRVFDRLLSCVDDTLQHEVGFLQLVVEEEIVLRELHYSALLVVLGEIGAQHIEATEHPATS